MATPSQNFVDQFNLLQSEIVREIRNLSPEERFKILTRKLKPQHSAKLSIRLHEKLQNIDLIILQLGNKERVTELRAKFLDYKANYDVIIDMLHYLALISFDSYIASHIQTELDNFAVAWAQILEYKAKKRKFESQDFPLLHAINESLLFRDGLNELSDKKKAEYYEEQMVWQIRASQNIEIAEAAFMLAAGKGKKLMAKITRVEMDNEESLAEDRYKWGERLKEGNVHILKGVMNRIQSKREIIALMGKHGFEDCRTVTDEKAQLEVLEKIQEELTALCDSQMKYEDEEIDVVGM